MLSKQLVLISKLTFKLWLWDLIMILDLSLKITVRLKFVFLKIYLNLAIPRTPKIRIRNNKFFLILEFLDDN